MDNKTNLFNSPDCLEAIALRELIQLFGPFANEGWKGKTILIVGTLQSYPYVLQATGAREVVERKGVFHCMLEPFSKKKFDIVLVAPDAFGPADSRLLDMLKGWMKETASLVVKLSSNLDAKREAISAQLMGNFSKYNESDDAIQCAGQRLTVQLEQWSKSPEKKVSLDYRYKEEAPDNIKGRIRPKFTTTNSKNAEGSKAWAK